MDTYTLVGPLVTLIGILISYHFMYPNFPPKL